jgi:diguanylate cyclase (GGDEF)-like protein
MTDSYGVEGSESSLPITLGPTAPRPIFGVHRSMVLVVGSYFALLTIWMLSSLGSPDTQALVLPAAALPPSFLAIFTAWRASRKCVVEPRTALAWRFIAGAFLFWTGSFCALLAFQAANGAEPSSVSAVDVYLGIYPLFLVGLLWFPTQAESKAGKRRRLIDAATIVVGGAAVIWVLVLGSTLREGGHNPLDSVVSGAYPIGDLLEIFALIYVITRVLTPATRQPLRLLMVGMLLQVVGDITQDWLILHPQVTWYPTPEVPWITWLAAICVYALAGTTQKRLADENREAVARVSKQSAVQSGRSALLSYLAPVIVFGLLMNSEVGNGSFFDRVALTICGTFVALLFMLRQAFARRDLLSTQGQLSYQALHDALTGMPNRALIMDRMEQLLARGRRNGTVGAVLYVDLDEFKNVNDSLGHEAGDQLLVAVTARLESSLRDVDTIGRMGGDEFVVLIDGASLEVAPELVAERLLEVMRQPFELAGVSMPLVVTTSIGIAMGDRATPGDLLRDADVALYEAKAAGKNQYAIFHPEMQAGIQERIELEFDLRSALEGGQFRLVYQPIYNLDDLTLVGVEALLRWDHPVRGVVGPDEFIPILEQTGQIREVGGWVMNQACEQMAVWHARGDTLDISVNVSGRQLDDDAIVDHIRHALDVSGLEATSLIIEVTETALMRNVNSTARRLRAVKALGVRIAVDDFGTGYSSLAYLQQFPVDCLKIDSSFTNAITTSPESKALIGTLVQLGKDLGLTTLAEGVETVGQMDHLRYEHVNEAQGFLLARPLDPETFENQLLAPTRPVEPRAELP